MRFICSGACDGRGEFPIADFSFFTCVPAVHMCGTRYKRLIQRFVTKTYTRSLSASMQVCTWSKLALVDFFYERKTPLSSSSLSSSPILLCFIVVDTFIQTLVFGFIHPSPRRKNESPFSLPSTSPPLPPLPARFVFRPPEIHPPKAICRRRERAPGHPTVAGA